jgi:hypothetical protein
MAHEVANTILQQNVRGGMNFKYTVTAEVSGVYADQLRRIFEKETGLYLSL